MFQTYSHTQRQLFALCPRKYQYAYAYGLRTLDPAGVPAVFSSMVIHPTLQAVHQAGSNWLEAGRAVAATCWQAFCQEVPEFERLAYQQCSLDVARRVVEQYAPLVYMDREEGWVCEGVEVTKEHPRLQCYEGRYRTRVDAIERREGEVMPIEFKVSSREQHGILEIDNQLVGHAACCGSNQVMHVFVYTKRESKRVVVQVMRQLVQIEPDMIAEWELETYGDMLALSQAWASKVWPKRTESCNAFGKLCVYADICRAGGLRGSVVERWKAILAPPVVKGGE